MNPKLAPYEKYRPRHAAPPHHPDLRGRGAIRDQRRHRQKDFERRARAVKKIIFTHCVCGAISGLLLLCSCATGTKPFAPAKQLPDEVAMNKEAGHGGQLNMTILFDGQKMPFIVDTGAPVTVLDKSLEPKLGKSYGTTSIWLAGGAKQKSGIFVAPKLYLSNTALMSGDIVGTYDFKGYPMGILGMDCLQHYCIQMDFQSGKMRFLDSNKLNTDKLGQCYPLTFKNGYPRINQAGLVGDNTNLLIDVGCNVDGATEKGTNEFEGVYLSKCDWNGETYTNLIIAAVGDANVLGLRFLARHLVTFDFPKQRMYLKRTSGSLIDATSSEAGSESTRKSGLRFLMNLKEQGQLPGWSKDSKEPVYFGESPSSDSNSAVFNLWKNGDATACHYAIARENKGSFWKLEKAWRTDQNGNTVEKFINP